jgi:hypothetical protein
MIREIILHCSDSSWGNATIITVWHIARQFRNCGYHFVILNGKISASCNLPEFDGHIETGRPLDEDGAHTLNHNDAIGICIIGKSNSFTSKQIETCKNLINNLKSKYEIGAIKQHSDYEPAKPFCAGFSKEIMGLFNV